ncbi:MAG: hypothetical protein ACTHLH_12445 [Solirubrobacterales bacterium]
MIAQAASAALQIGIDNFKNQLLYDGRESEEIHLGSAEEYTEGSFPARFAERIEGNDWSRFQPMLSESEYFFSLTRLPVDPFDRYVGVRNLLHRASPIYDDLLAVLVNKLGNEFTLVWPKGAEASTHERILNFFLATHDRVWVEAPYEDQTPAAICDPAIWFYENSAPERL